jgi:protoporphyrinogen oxidase
MSSSGSLRRREILATFLGASFAAACRSPRKAKAPAGALLGQSQARGHRVRDPHAIAALVARADLPVERTRVAIIGGGPSGLAAGWRLVRAGMRDFRILELEDEPGGTARGGESPVARYPWGAHYVPVPTVEARALVALLDELGVVEGRKDDGTPIIAEQVVCRAPEERLFHHGTWYEGLYLHAGASASDLAQFRAFKKELARWSRFRDEHGLRAFVIPLARASKDPEVLALDRISMAAWMDERGLTSRRLRWLVDYACRDDYALSIDRASAWAGLFYFVARLGEGDRAAELMTWEDGNGRLVRHLASVTAPFLSCGETVVDVTPQDGGVSITLLDRAGVPRRILAERAIVAVPRHVARAIVTPLRTQDRALEKSAFDYGAWAVANLHLRGRPAVGNGVPFAWDNVFYESKSLGYVVATHQLGRDHGPTIWTWYYAFPEPGDQARERLASAGYEEWSSIALADLGQAHPDVGEHLERLDVYRWAHAMVRPTVGARAALAKVAPEVARGAIHFAHTDLSGLALFEEAQDHGVRAAEEVLAGLGIASPSIRV